MFFKAQNIRQTMHLTMLIAHPYWTVPEHFRECLARYVENFLHYPIVRPVQSLEGRPMVTSISIIHGPMTARYVISQEDQDLAAFYSNPTNLLASGASCSPARHVQ